MAAVMPITSSRAVRSLVMVPPSDVAQRVAGTEVRAAPDGDEDDEGGPGDGRDADQCHGPEWEQRCDANVEDAEDVGDEPTREQPAEGDADQPSEPPIDTASAAKSR